MSSLASTFGGKLLSSLAKLLSSLVKLLTKLLSTLVQTPDIFSQFGFFLGSFPVQILQTHVDSAYQSKRLLVFLVLLSKKYKECLGGGQHRGHAAKAKNFGKLKETQGTMFRG